MNGLLTDKLFCLSEDEFIALASACGLQEVCGFAMDQTKGGSFSENQYHQAIFTLYRKNLLKADGDGFVIEPELECIFKVIREARCVLELQYGDEEKIPQCTYFGKSGNAYARPSTDGVDYVSLGSLPQTIGEYLRSGELFPNEAIPEDVALTWEKNGGETCEVEEPFEQLQDVILKVVLLDNETRKAIRKLAVVRRGNREYLVTEGQDAARRTEPYGKERIAQRIMEGLEVEHDFS